MKAGVIPGGRCAVLRVNAASHNLEPPAFFLYRDWLPASGEETRDFPIYCQRHFTRAAPGAGYEMTAELYLPIK
jgi:AraC family transcriptional regulator